MINMEYILKNGGFMISKSGLPRKRETYHENIWIWNLKDCVGKKGVHIFLENVFLWFKRLGCLGGGKHILKEVGLMV